MGWGISGFGAGVGMAAMSETRFLMVVIVAVAESSQRIVLNNKSEIKFRDQTMVMAMGRDMS